LPGGLHWVFDATNTRFVPVHIAVVTITGRVDEEMQKEENNYCPTNIYLWNKAECKQIYRQQKEGKLKAE